MADGALLAPGDAAWAEALRRVRHDVYHLSEYVRLDAELTGGEPGAFRFDEGEHVLLVPLVLRAVPGTGLRDAISPYGYPGPVSTAGPRDTAFWSRAARAMAELLRAYGVVTAFVRLHPLLPAALPALATAGTVVRHGSTVFVDLTESEEEIWRRTGRTHRNQINKARRQGVEVVFDDWGLLDAWVDTYHANMRRVGAGDFYFFGHEHFHRLRDALGDGLHLAAAHAGGELLGGNMFFEHDGIVQTYLQSTRDGAVTWADKLLYHEVRMWAKARGNRVHHLGGGLGGAADSLFRYKAGFSDALADFHTWRVVADVPAYERLAGPVTEEALTGRFPAYR